MKVVRFNTNPIIYPEMPGLEGERGQNINGPSLIRVPAWVENPLGTYYLYFAHHGGKYIRLAYADDLRGPWTVHEPGALKLEEAPCDRHIASPDVHVDEARREIRMYFHGPCPDSPEARAMFKEAQVSFAALSKDGLHFKARPDILGLFYFRVFKWEGMYYAVAKNRNEDGILYRSADGFTPFEPGPTFMPGIRHSAIEVTGDRVWVYFSRAGDCPECILRSELVMSGPWTAWTLSAPEVVLKPERNYEGGDLPLIPSRYGAIKGPARQLRDPGIFEENGRKYLLYSIAGEQGIAMAEMVA